MLSISPWFICTIWQHFEGKLIIAFLSVEVSLVFFFFFPLPFLIWFQLLKRQRKKEEKFQGIAVQEQNEFQTTRNEDWATCSKSYAHSSSLAAEIRFSMLMLYVIKRFKASRQFYISKGWAASPLMKPSITSKHIIEFCSNSSLYF